MQLLHFQFLPWLVFYYLLDHVQQLPHVLIAMELPDDAVTDFALQVGYFPVPLSLPLPLPGLVLLLLPPLVGRTLHVLALLVGRRLGWLILLVVGVLAGVVGGVPCLAGHWVAHVLGRVVDGPKGVLIVCPIALILLFVGRYGHLLTPVAWRQPLLIGTILVRHIDLRGLTVGRIIGMGGVRHFVLVGIAIRGVGVVGVDRVLGRVGQVWGWLMVVGVGRLGRSQTSLLPLPSLVMPGLLAVLPALGQRHGAGLDFNLFNNIFRRLLLLLIKGGNMPGEAVSVSVSFRVSRRGEGDGALGH